MITLGISRFKNTVSNTREIILSDALVKIVVSADSLVREIDASPQGGEWKRHQVYSQMLKKYPDKARNDISLAIELAVQKMKGKLF